MTYPSCLMKLPYLGDRHPFSICALRVVVEACYFSFYHHVVVMAPRYAIMHEGLRRLVRCAIPTA